jgi:hypothetical protein
MRPLPTSAATASERFRAEAGPNLHRPRRFGRRREAVPRRPEKRNPPNEPKNPAMSIPEKRRSGLATHSR